MFVERYQIVVQSIGFIDNLSAMRGGGFVAGSDPKADDVIGIEATFGHHHHHVLFCPFYRAGR